MEFWFFGIIWSCLLYPWSDRFAYYGEHTRSWRGMRHLSILSIPITTVMTYISSKPLSDGTVTNIVWHVSALELISMALVCATAEIGAVGLQYFDDCMRPCSFEMFASPTGCVCLTVHHYKSDLLFLDVLLILPLLIQRTDILYISREDLYVLLTIGFSSRSLSKFICMLCIKRLYRHRNMIAIRCLICIRYVLLVVQPEWFLPLIIALWLARLQACTRTEGKYRKCWYSAGFS